MATRPELVAPPEVFYNEEEARKYTSNSHMIDTQARAALLRAQGQRMRVCGCVRLLRLC
jgi:18S rRNA (guanine1575-N7)-methyltransferase